MIATAAQVRNELVVLVRTWALPVAVIVALALTLGNVLNGVNAVTTSVAQLTQTRAMYAENGMDFEAALRAPVTVTGSGSMSEIDNFARYDYDTLVAAVAALRPEATVNETLGYLSFVLFPALFFLLGLWLSTVQRARGFEKTTLVRVGPRRMVLARQSAVVVAGLAVTGVSVTIDVVARGVARVAVERVASFEQYPPLHPLPESAVGQQLVVCALVVVCCGWAGIATGALAGSFAIPAIVFVAYNYVVPVLVAWDPRNWLLVLGHGAFEPSPGFTMATSVPMDGLLALIAVVIGAIVAGLGAQVATRARNPLAV